MPKQSIKTDLPEVLTDGDIETLAGGGSKTVKAPSDDGRSNGDSVPQDSFSINFAKIETGP